MISVVVLTVDVRAPWSRVATPLQWTRSCHGGRKRLLPAILGHVEIQVHIIYHLLSFFVLNNRFFRYFDESSLLFGCEFCRLFLTPYVEKLQSRPPITEIIIVVKGCITWSKCATRFQFCLWLTGKKELYYFFSKRLLKKQILS